MTVLLFHAGGAILCRILTSSAGVSLAPFEDQDIVRLIYRSRDENWKWICNRTDGKISICMP